MWQVNDDEYASLQDALVAVQRLVEEGDVEDWDNLDIERDDAEVILDGEPTMAALSAHIESYDEATLTVRVTLTVVVDEDIEEVCARVALAEIPSLLMAWVDAQHTAPAPWTWLPFDDGRLI